MLSKVSRLPRDDRWDALARGALRDDLYSVLESLTRSVIEVGGDAGTDPAPQWEAWEKANKESIQRARPPCRRSAGSTSPTSRPCRWRCARCARSSASAPPPDRPPPQLSRRSLHLSTPTRGEGSGADGRMPGRRGGRTASVVDGDLGFGA